MDSDQATFSNTFFKNKTWYCQPCLAIEFGCEWFKIFPWWYNSGNVAVKCIKCNKFDDNCVAKRDFLF